MKNIHSPQIKTQAFRRYLPLLKPKLLILPQPKVQAVTSFSANNIKEVFTVTKGKIARENFMNGLNCSQAVAVAFADEMNMPKELVAKLTIGFGGGIGRMREVCGAVYYDEKSDIYKIFQAVSNEYKEENGSIICRELLGISKPGPDSPIAEKRTKEYYKKRPCPELVELAGDILEKYISNNPYKK